MKDLEIVIPPEDYMPGTYTCKITTFNNDCQNTNIYQVFHDKKPTGFYFESTEEGLINSFNFFIYSLASY